MSIIIYLLFSFFILFLGFILIVKKDDKFNANKLLATALIVKSVIQLNYALIILLDHNLFLELFNKASEPLYYALPPLIFFYYRNTLTVSNRIRKFDLVHFIPFVFIVILNFNLLGYNFNSSIFQHQSISINELILVNSISSQINPLFQPLTFLIYLLTIYVLYLKHFPVIHFKSLNSNIQWLMVFYLILFCTQLAKIAKIFYGDLISNTIGDLIFITLFFASIALIIYLIVFFVTLMKGITIFRNHSSKD